MTLDQYLTETGETSPAFGARCKPPIHRTEVWKIRRRERSPGAEKIAAIEIASNYRVRAADLIGIKRKKSKRGHVSPRKVANQ